MGSKHKSIISYLMAKIYLLFVLLTTLFIIINIIMYNMKVYTILNMASLLMFMIACRTFFLPAELSYHFNSVLPFFIILFIPVGSLVFSIISVHIKINFIGIIMLIVSGLIFLLYIGFAIIYIVIEHRGLGDYMQ